MKRLFLFLIGLFLSYSVFGAHVFYLHNGGEIVEDENGNVERLGKKGFWAIPAIEGLASGEIKRLEGFLMGVNKKLENERFVSSAPAAVVELERKKKADAETKIEALKKQFKL
mgnify:CR=1 FL=1